MGAGDIDFSLETVQALITRLISPVRGLSDSIISKAGSQTCVCGHLRFGFNSVF